MTKTTPNVRRNQLWLADCDQPLCTLNSDAWFAWLTDATRFRYHSRATILVSRHFSRPMVAISVRLEPRRRGALWYAYRRVDRILHKRYVGTSAALTTARLDSIATELNLL